MIYLEILMKTIKIAYYEYPCSEFLYDEDGWDSEEE